MMSSSDKASDIIGGQRKLVIVLGPHRSGTSLGAAAIGALGANLGISSLYSNEENKRGFFEHPEVVELNDRLLSHLGGSWDNPGFFGKKALSGVDTACFERDAIELLGRLFQKTNFSAVKDPRICQLLPFWLSIFEHCGYKRDDLYFVHMVRDPLEVSLSQATRAEKNPSFYEFGRLLQEGAALWLSLTVQALQYSKSYKNLFVAYDQLLEEPQRQLDRLASFLDVRGCQEELDEFVANFVDKSLHRSKPGDEARSVIGSELPEVYEVYEELTGVTQRGVIKDVPEVQDIFNRESTQLHFYRAQVGAISRLSERCRRQGHTESRLNAEIQHLNNQVREFKEELDKQVLVYRTELEKQTADYQAVLKEANASTASSEEKCAALEGKLEVRDEELALARTSLKESEKREQALIKKLALARTSLKESERREQVLLEELENIRHSGPSESAEALTMTRLVTEKMNSFAMHRWMAFRALLRSAFLQLNQRSPRVASFLKTFLRPAVRLTERYILRLKHDPFITGGRSWVSSNDICTRYQQYTVNPEYQPLVTVIVPNYNHESFLRQRLESIYSQSYQNYEVILLDDCSSDKSVTVLQEFHKRYPDKTTLIANEKNSGGVFYQWEKGLSLANGEIIWIAESDDYCSENFLDTLVPYFQNEAVNLAYSRTTFVQGGEANPFWSIEEYLSDISETRWKSAFVETANKLVADAFSIKNIIPNVSSALFRNQGSLDVLQDPVWRQMRTCGDWVLYLHLIRGGLLAFDPGATNYYRIHDKNTSVNSYSDDAFYQEHELVAKTVQRYFRVPPEVYDAQRKNLITHWKQTRTDFTEGHFNQCYSISRIQDEVTERATNLLMAGYGFCAGGGETFPILLANLMKDLGYNVTFLDCAQEARLPEIRKSLRPDIPVVSDLANLPNLINDFGIDVIHSHHAWVDNTILNLIPPNESVRTVVTLHGMYETIDDANLRELLPRLVKRSAKIVYTAEKNLTAIRAHGYGDSEKISRIDNALDLYDFDPIQRSDIGVPEDAFLLTVVSRAIPDKGWKEAIAAVEIAREKSGSDIHLVLIGEGPVYAELERNGVPDFVHLEGFRKNLRSYFAVSDLGFLPSRFEGESFPLVIIDCLHSGVPVLASSVGEIPYMLETEQGPAGALFELEDWSIPVDELGEFIGELSRNPARVREMRSSVPAAAKKFDPYVLAEQYDAAYQEALSVNNQT